MSDTQLVQVNQQPDAAILAQGGLGLEGVGLKPEPMILVQPTTKDLPKGTQPGIFYDKSTGDTFEILKIVPIKMNPVRAKYPSKNYKPGEKATCKSRDGLVPVIGSKFLVPEAPKCGYMQGDRFIAVCDFAKWDNSGGKTGKEAAPHCKEDYRIDFIHFDTKLPFFITLSGMSVGVAKKIKGAIKRQAAGYNASLKEGQLPANLFDYVVEIGSTHAGDSAAFMIEGKRVQRMAPDKVAEFGPMYLEILRQRQAYAAAREAEKNHEDVNSAVGDIIDGDYDEDTPVEV